MKMDRQTQADWEDLNYMNTHTLTHVIETILNIDGWTKSVVSDDYIEAVKTVNLDSHMAVMLSLRVAPANATIQWKGSEATTPDGAAQFAIALCIGFSRQHSTQEHHQSFRFSHHMKNPAAVTLGRMGGQARSKAKTLAARKNAKKPRKPGVRITADLQNGGNVVCIGAR